MSNRSVVPALLGLLVCIVSAVMPVGSAAASDVPVLAGYRCHGPSTSSAVNDALGVVYCVKRGVALSPRYVVAYADGVRNANGWMIHGSCTATQGVTRQWEASAGLKAGLPDDWLYGALSVEVSSTITKSLSSQVGVSTSFDIPARRYMHCVRRLILKRWRATFYVVKKIGPIWAPQGDIQSAVFSAPHARQWNTWTSAV